MYAVYVFRDFLTGFHKRKLQRKKEAKEKFEKDFKQERKRIKKEAKESYKKMLMSHKPIPELQNLLQGEYEEDDANVKIVELSTDKIAEKCHWIGANKPITSEEMTIMNGPEEGEECPGMDLGARKNSIVEKDEKKQLFTSKKDFKKSLKKQSTKTVQKSKIFQMKNKLEQKKQKKKLKTQKEKIKLRDKKPHLKQRSIHNRK